MHTYQRSIEHTTYWFLWQSNTEHLTCAVLKQHTAPFYSKTNLLPPVAQPQGRTYIKQQPNGADIQKWPQGRRFIRTTSTVATYIQTTATGAGIHTNNRHRGGHIQTTATVQSEQTTNNTRDRVIQLRYSCINPCQWQQIWSYIVSIGRQRDIPPSTQCIRILMLLLM